MTSPYTSSLLQDSSRRPGTLHAEHRSPMVMDPAPPAPLHTRSVTHVSHPAPAMHQAPVQHQQQPQVVYVQQQGGAGGSRLAPLVLGIVVLLLGAVAAFAGYQAAQQAAPSANEAATVTQVAAADGFFTGRQRGEALGRADGYERASSVAQLRTAMADQRAWNQGWSRGVKLGQSSYRSEPAYSYGGGYRGGGGGYRGYRYGGFGSSAVTGALWQAQGLANATGSPVDVEVY